LLSVREEIFEVPTPPLSAHSLYLVECTRSVFAITLNFGLVDVGGVRAIVTAVRFSIRHCAFARRVRALVLSLSIHLFNPTFPEPSRVDASHQPLCWTGTLWTTCL